ncbi:CvpA family protein [Micavibrio aeruginosavorus]|uniref:CvpA family protein n=1 Tax=Micavibrio aeruginosavorus TaxID=349221 RepID=UPI003F4A95C8
MFIDITVAVIVVISAIIAFLRGFIREVLTIAGVVGGLVAAVALGPLVRPSFNGWFGVPADEAADMPKLFDIVPMDIVAQVCAYASIFLIVVIALTVVSHLLCGFAKKIGLGPVDRTLGVVFGIARAAVLLALLYLPVYLMVDKDDRDEWFKDSRSAVYIEGLAAWMAAFIPEDTAEKLAEGAGRTREDMENARERIDALDALKEQMQNVEEAVQDGAEAIATPDEPSEGYEPVQRDDLDQLIENVQPEPQE